MIIPKKEIAAYQRWQADSFDRKPPPPAPPPKEPPPEAEAAPLPEPEPAVRLPTVEDIERIHEEARASGHAAGLAEGRAAAAEECRQAAALAARQFVALTDDLRKALEQIDQAVAEQLLALGIEIAAQVMRGQIAVREDVLLPIVREAIAALPLHNENVTLRLNPADAADLRRLMGDELADNGVQIAEDGALGVGSCLLQSGASEIDAGIETRWKRVLETIGATPRTWQQT
ncbi:MAG: flagellar assembly protein FliH [Azonexus sp.]|jgi:flagellar assembly protein FliH|nr:flagellar assembly protein FliH [Azonexus sp.]